jgi:transposase
MKVSTKFITELSNEDKEKLTRIMQTDEKHRKRMRAHSIILSFQGYSIDTIADIYQVHRNSVTGWLAGWEEEGYESLEDKPKTGRPTILDEAEQELAKRIIAEHPRSTKKAILEIEKQTGKEISHDTLKRIIKGADYIWKRVKKTLKFGRVEEEFAKSQWELDDLQEKADEGLIDLYYCDAAGFCLDPSICYAWQIKGNNIEIPKARSKRINVFGFFNTKNDFSGLMFEGNLDSHVIIGCIDWFIKQVNKQTYLVIDNAPIHISDELEDCIQAWKKLGIILYFLPAYSPELNKIEILWRKIKYEWMPFSAYDSLASLKDALCEIFANIGSKYTISFAY